MPGPAASRAQGGPRSRSASRLRTVRPDARAARVGRAKPRPGSKVAFSSHLHQKQRLRSHPDFDLEAPRTYYTRPMSPPWSKPLDIDRLADGEADIDFAVPLAELPRLR